MDHMTPFTLGLPVSLKERLQRIAEREAVRRMKRVSVAALIREAIERTFVETTVLDSDEQN